MKYYGVQHAYAYLAQAIIASAFLCHDDEFFHHWSYDEMYEPLISIHNEIYPGYIVMNPVDSYSNKSTVKSVTDISYLECLCNILREMGISVDKDEAIKVIHDHHWSSKRGMIEKPCDFLGHYTGTTWSRRIITVKQRVVKLPEDGYVIYKRYYTRARHTVYSRVHSPEEVGYTSGTLLIFKEANE